MLNLNGIPRKQGYLVNTGVGIRGEDANLGIHGLAIPAFPNDVWSIDRNGLTGKVS